MYYTQPPMGYYYAPPPTPEQCEKKCLRSDSNFVGFVMLGVVAGTQLTFTLLALLLCAVGVLDIHNLGVPQMGLSHVEFLLFYGVVYLIAMVLPAVIVALCSGRRYFPLGPAERFPSGIAFLGLLSAVGACMLANIFANMFVQFLHQFGVPIPQPPDMMQNSPISFVLNLVIFAVLPALAEELVFRGYVLRSLRPYGDGFAVVVSSVLFGLMHGNVSQIPFALCVGLVIGWLYVSTNNIWLPIAVHFCNNAISVLASYLSMTASPESASLFSLLIFGGLIVMGVIAAVILFVTHPEICRPKTNACCLSAGQKAGTAFSSPALAIACVIFVILTFVEILK